MATDTRPTRLRICSQRQLPLSLSSDSAFGPFELQQDDSRELLLSRIAEGCDALLLHDGPEAIEVAAEAGREVALIVVVEALEPAGVIAWFGRGAQDVLLEHELAEPSLPRRLRAAIERKRIERDARTAYATDLDTGLPHQQQLMEHMSQLLALREREPAPMAVLVLRVEGFATTEARLGRESSGVLRRKVGVRLRAGVRASDVVASLGDDSFAVLLGSILTPADALRVGAKLVESLTAPFRVAGVDLGLATALGIAQYPQDGAQPEVLLRRAVGLAAAAAAEGRVGFANFVEAGAAGPSAANDD